MFKKLIDNFTKSPEKEEVSENDTHLYCPEAELLKLDLDIVKSDNPFESRFLTYSKYIINNRSLIIDCISHSKNHNIILMSRMSLIDFFKFENIVKEKNKNFKFVIEFARAYYYIRELFPAPRNEDYYLEYIEEEDVNSEKVIIHKYNSKYTFDFYGIPSMINSMFENPLETFMKKSQVDNDTKSQDNLDHYIGISYSPDAFREKDSKSLTIQDDYNFDTEEDIYDNIWLHKVFFNTYSLCNTIYKNTLRDIGESLLYTSVGNYPRFLEKDWLS